MTIRGLNYDQICSEDAARPDPVNAPAHYTVGGIETIDFMKAKSTPEEFHGYLRLNCMKYLSRCNYKENELQDLKKALWYLQRLLKEKEL